MKRRLELNARVELCRKFAKLEPHASYIWLAEAERWSRLTREPFAIDEHVIFVAARRARAADIQMRRALGLL
jgi:hypothetical protein